MTPLVSSRQPLVNRSLVVFARYDRKVRPEVTLIGRAREVILAPTPTSPGERLTPCRKQKRKREYENLLPAGTPRR